MIASFALTADNGLVVDSTGVQTLNGLTTVRGQPELGGRAVDCSERDEAACTGEPDGLLSAATGLMSSDEGIATATYLVRCALPAAQEIRIRDYTGALVSMSGESGLAPEWKDGQCGADCQERVSACLMALTNGDGVHVSVEMAAPFVLGADHAYPFQEAAFYGNVFAAEATASYCVGRDYVKGGVQAKSLETRACAGYNEEQGGSCPYVKVGYCNEVFSRAAYDTRIGGKGDEKCTFVGDVAVSCKDSRANPLYAVNVDGKVWQNPITTFRKVQE